MMKRWGLLWRWAWPAWLVAVVLVGCAAARGPGAPQPALPSEAALVPPKVLNRTAGIGPRELGIIVNTRDPLSVMIGDYYRKARHIPPENVIRIAFEPGRAVLPVDEFKRLKRTVDRKTPDHVQGYALTWALPYRVGCMSITTAFAAGFDPAWCAQGCKPTRISPYFNSTSRAPWTDFKLRPTMSIAATSFAAAKALIDRGVAADASFPRGTAYLIETPDNARNVRSKLPRRLPEQINDRLRYKRLKTRALRGRRAVVAYFTGLTQVPDIASNRFLPGAVADHLTSTGGVLDGTGQMSALRWLEAGATGSYGAVVEPCNFVSKFPHPEVMLAHYAAGESLLEAYWKSVQMPGQGIFVGEPLAKPYGGFRVRLRGKTVRIYSTLLGGRDYTVYGAVSPVGPFRQASARLHLAPGQHELVFEDDPVRPFYLIRETPAGG